MKLGQAPLCLLLCLLLYLLRHLSCLCFLPNTSPARPIGTTFKLQGSKDYDDWSHQISLLLSALHLDKVVLDGIKPSGGGAETLVYQNMVCDALYLLTQVVSKPVMRKISRMRDPHEIWTHLRTTYYRDNSFNFVWQLHSLFKLSEKFNSDTFGSESISGSISGSTSDFTSEKSPLESFVDEYEQQYDRIRNLVAASKFEENNTAYKTFLDSDRAKKDYLLTALTTKYPSIVDNIATKDLLRYEEVKDKLSSLHCCSSKAAIGRLKKLWWLRLKRNHEIQLINLGEVFLLPKSGA